MVAYPRDVLNQRATDLYARIDRDANGVINAGEATLAAKRLRKDPDLRDAARDVFGLVPASASELLRFVGSSPRQVAQTRIFSFNPHEDRLCKRLSKTLAKSSSGPVTRDKDALFSDAMAQLIHMSRVCDSRQRGGVIDRVLWGLSRQHNGAMREFYLALADEAFGNHLDAPQRFAYQELSEVTVRSQFPVEAWTAGRTKPLRVSEIVHPEFWRRVCGYYRNRGFELLTKNASDTRRTYQRVITDPSGSKAPLKVHVEVAQGSRDLYAKLDRADLHVLVYDGHWELGGNGTQSIQASPGGRGVTKLIVQDGCRTIQNYDEFIDRHRDAMVIGSMTPIFADTKPILDVIFEGLARGATLGWVRHRIAKKAYFSRDEFEKLRQHADLDNDQRADNAAGERDQHFDVNGHRASAQFLSAIEFANTELFYHADHARDEGKRSYLGSAFGDHMVAVGAVTDAQPGEVVRVTPKKSAGANGKSEMFFDVAYNPAYTHRRAEEYAGLVTAYVAMEAIRHKVGTVSDFDRMRAIIMGAAAIQFLGAYAKRGNTGFKGYLAHFGLPAIPPKRMMDFLEKKEGYGDDAQTRRFIDFVDSYR